VIYSNQYNDLELDFHIPVLSHKAVEYLINPSLNDLIIVDGTTGGGGYSEIICKQLQNSGKLICFDKDLNALSFTQKRLSWCQAKIEFVNGNFGNLKEELNKSGIDRISGIVLDLGLSSYQLEKEDGFSYMRNTPLDMRADIRDKETASDLINSKPRRELEIMFSYYGEIGNAGRLADLIAEKRKRRKIETTGELIEVINSGYNLSKSGAYDFYSKIFQALRIAVNNELENLRDVLNDSLDILEEGGRLVVVSYHSLEDRMVKNFMRDNKATKKGDGKLKVLTKKALTPGEEEIKENRRSRSAKLRAAEKIK
jgi:16S rRNA (cytosine1402-N4)-methyltransferase